MKHLRLAGILMTVLCVARPCAAASSAGAEPFNFLFLDANARAVGMGGAYTALAADSNALLYNPAGLGRIANREATFMHNQHFESITQEYLGFADPRGWGASLNYLNFGDVPKTTISNPGGTGLGTAGLTDLALGAGYGRPINDSLSVGAGVKLIKESIDNVSVTGFALDLGALYAPPGVPKLTLGLAIQNLGPAVKFQSADESLPLNVRAGAAYGFTLLDRKSTAAIDIAKEKSGSALLGLGLEIFADKAVPVRLGFNTRDGAGSGLSAGLGWIHKSFNFDYAIVSYGDLGLTHRISLTYTWGRSGDPL
ncbi:MAG: PorV/PorQ family protein [Elusimicrobia bacterium]|nr:PorV/PorQ family protein [Elusimicrobiota bacterium]